MDLSLKGRKAVVTGGTAGIGLAIVELLATEGCEIITCSRSAERNKALEARVSLAKADTVDLFDNSAKDWLASVGHFDISIPNVSAMSADWPDCIDLNINTTVAMTEAAMEGMAHSENATITYVGSKAATYATPGFESYGATKAAMVHYMKSLSQRAAGKVRVNTVSPGDTFVDGGFWDDMKKSAPEVYEATMQSNPMKRFCTPEEVASAVVFVSSPRASFINGAHLVVDGGATVHVHG